ISFVNDRVQPWISRLDLRNGVLDQFARSDLLPLDQLGQPHRVIRREIGKRTHRGGRHGPWNAHCLRSIWRCGMLLLCCEPDIFDYWSPQFSLATNELRCLRRGCWSRIHPKSFELLIDRGLLEDSLQVPADLA